MYLPGHFRMDGADEMHRLLRQYPLGTWVLATEQGLQAHHLPFWLDTDAGDQGCLRAHVARANPVWQQLDGRAGLVIFQSTDTYVTPAWYPSKREHGKVVPTWNYSAVHVQGTARAIEDRDWLHRLVQQLTDAREAQQPKPWQVADAPDDYIERMLGAIVGIEITITAWLGKRKAGQNRTAPERAGLAQGLRAQGLRGEDLPWLSADDA